MNVRPFFSALVFGFLLSACGAKKIEDNAYYRKSKEKEEKTRAIEDVKCPLIDGKYVSGEKVKYVGFEVIKEQRFFEDTGIRWLISGRPEEIQDMNGQVINYVGVCANEVLTITVFKGVDRVVQFQYSRDSAFQMLIHTSMKGSVEPQLVIWSPSK